MSLFETLIGIAEKAWRDKPRKDVVRAFVLLRISMIECQESYDAYVQLVNEKADHSQIDSAYSRWASAIRRLRIVIGDVNRVMQIFTPETYRQVVTYYGVDHILLGKGTEFDAPPPGVTLAVVDLDRAADALAQSLDIDVAEKALAPTFKLATERLDVFIRENFKIEEIHAAYPRSAGIEQT